MDRKNPEEMCWRRETETQKVEELLLEWCTYHFSQKNDTLLSSPRWRTLMDPRDPGDKIEEMLEGSEFMDAEEKGCLGS